VDFTFSIKGRKDIIYPIAKAVLSAGADGRMVEVHPKPDKALSDGKQQMNMDEFTEFIDNFNKWLSR